MKSFTTFVAASAAFGVVSAMPSPQRSWGYKGHKGGKWDNKSGGRHNYTHEEDYRVSLGPRPYYLVNDMDESPLKEKLESCSEDEPEITSFSIAHRGAPLMFPEHSREGYEAAARMGAGRGQTCTYIWFSTLTRLYKVSSSAMLLSPVTVSSSAATPTAIFTTQPTSSPSPN